MKYKLLRRRWSISAPRMTVRTHRAWPIRLAVLLGWVGLGVVLAVLVYQVSTHFVGLDQRELMAELDQLRKETTTLRAERDRLAAENTSAASLTGVERSAREQLASQIHLLEAENVRLREDLAFFETLSAKGISPGLAIKQLQVEPDGVPQQMRYRMLVVQGERPAKDFSGELRLTLMLQQGGKAVMIDLPTGLPEAEAKPYQIAFRFYTRLEGSFRIPPEATLRQVQARILERGKVRAQQTVVLQQ